MQRHAVNFLLLGTLLEFRGVVAGPHLRKVREKRPLARKVFEDAQGSAPQVDQDGHAGLLPEEAISSPLRLAMSPWLALRSQQLITDTP